MQTKSVNSTNPDTKTCQELLIEYQKRKEKDQFPDGKLMNFDMEKEESYFHDYKKDEDSITVYNPTKPIIIEGKRHIFSRVEPKAKEDNSIILLFEQNENGDWVVDPYSPIFKLQDPFHCGVIEGFHIVGGVRVYKEESGELGYETVFYKYEHSHKEEKSNKVVAEAFAVGPKKMKDIRLVEIEKGRIGVFTRPQGEYGGRGQIGYIEIENLDQLQDRLIKHANEKKANELLNIFVGNEWGGANELHLLPDKKIGVIGHIAEEINHNGRFVRDYHAISFIFDPKNRQVDDLKIIATAEDFPFVEPKKKSLRNIIFSGGLAKHENGEATFYAGIGDVSAGYKMIKNPFAV